MHQQINYAWRGFKPGLWQRDVNVRWFLQQNYTPYDGDAAFLAPATERTQAHLEKTGGDVRRGAQEKGRARCFPDAEFDHGARARIHRQRERSHRRPSDGSAAQARHHAQWRSAHGAHFAQGLRLRAGPGGRGGVQQVSQDAQRGRVRRLHGRHPRLPQFAHPHGAARCLWPRAHHRRLPPGCALRRGAADQAEGSRKRRRSTAPCPPRTSFAIARN